MLGAGVALISPDGQRQPLVTMRELAPGTDRYGADVTVTSEGPWRFRVEAWGDPIAHWQHDAAIKIPRGQDVELMLAEGAILFDRAARSVRPFRTGQRQTAGARWVDAARAAEAARAARAALTAAAARLRDPALPPWDRLAAASGEEITAILASYPLRDLVTRSARFPVIVHRQRALYGSWYEFFPRSEGVQTDPMGRREPIGGTLRSASGRLEAIAGMGFDVVYLPPVHPIGTTARKGPNNVLHAGPGDPGSPWAIGSPEGGHDAIHPDLGTMADFDGFVARTRELGMEVALDFALQTSPDHPWVTEHPEWFTTRADGSDRLRREPAQEIPGHLPAQLRP